MAKIYVEKLSALIHQLGIEQHINAPVEIKHFFSGAALYIQRTICATWSPVGLAFKLPEAEVNKLVFSGEGKPLKYFAKGHIKKGYVLFETPEQQEPNNLEKYFIQAAQHATKDKSKAS